MDISVATLIVSALAALLGWYAGREGERRAYRLSATSFATDWIRDLRTWASEAIDVLSEAIYHTPARYDDGETDPELVRRYRHQLSSITDRGRFFFPTTRRKSMVKKNQQPFAV